MIQPPIGYFKSNKEKDDFLIAQNSFCMNHESEYKTIPLNNVLLNFVKPFILTKEKIEKLHLITNKFRKIGIPKPIGIEVIRSLVLGDRPKSIKQLHPIIIKELEMEIMEFKKPKMILISDGMKSHKIQPEMELEALKFATDELVKYYQQPAPKIITDTINKFIDDEFIDFNKIEKPIIFQDFPYGKTILLDTFKIQCMNGKLIKKLIEFRKITPKSINIEQNQITFNIGHLELKKFVFQVPTESHKKSKKIENIEHEEFWRMLQQNGFKDKVPLRDKHSAVVVTIKCMPIMQKPTLSSYNKTNVCNYYNYTKRSIILNKKDHSSLFGYEIYIEYIILHNMSFIKNVSIGTAKWEWQKRTFNHIIGTSNNNDHSFYINNISSRIDSLECNIGFTRKKIEELQKKDREISFDTIKINERINKLLNDEDKFKQELKEIKKIKRNLNKLYHPIEIIYERLVVPFESNGPISSRMQIARFTFNQSFHKHKISGRFSLQNPFPIHIPLVELESVNLELSKTSAFNKYDFMDTLNKYRQLKNNERRQNIKNYLKLPIDHNSWKQDKLELYINKKIEDKEERVSLNHKYQDLISLSCCKNGKYTLPKTINSDHLQTTDNIWLSINNKESLIQIETDVKSVRYTISDSNNGISLKALLNRVLNGRFKIKNNYERYYQENDSSPLKKRKLTGKKIESKQMVINSNSIKRKSSINLNQNTNNINKIMKFKQDKDFYGYTSENIPCKIKELIDNVQNLSYIEYWRLKRWKIEPFSINDSKMILRRARNVHFVGGDIIETSYYNMLDFINMYIQE